jgi:hypothetical protein
MLSRLCQGRWLAMERSTFSFELAYVEFALSVLAVRLSFEYRVQVNGMG